MSCDISAENRYASTAYIEFCLPTDWDAAPQGFRDAFEFIYGQFMQSSAGSYFVDVFNAKYALSISFFTAVILCMTYTMLMSYASEALAWICIFLTWVGLIGASVGCWMLRTDTLLLLEEQIASGMSGEDLLPTETQAQHQIIGCVASGTLAILYSCSIWCYWGDLQTAIDVIDASSDFLADTYRIIWTPVIHFILQTVVLFVWLGAMGCIVSMNDITPSNVIPQMKNLEWRTDVQYMAFFMFFGLLWLMALLDYLNRFIIICSASTYYFNNKRSETETQQPASVQKAWHIAYLNHMGSIAVGAFIIAVIRLIKYTLVFMM